jgi:mRNA interferase RelE/StbE
VPPALEEWSRLDGSVKESLRKLLKKRLAAPHVPGSKLHGALENCYKIKLRKQGYRLVYTVIDEDIVVLVLSVDKREDALAYLSAQKRLNK